MLLTRTHFHAAAFARQSQNHGPFPSISFYREQFAEGLIPGERADWGNGNHIAALHEASTLAYCYCSPWSMDRSASWLDLTACRLSLID
jgi:hypothetical protein